MNPTVFNSVAQVLELALPRAGRSVEPDATLAQLGLRSAAAGDFVSAVEDAFRLRLPRRPFGGDEGELTLRHLCRAVETAEAIAGTA